MLWLVRSEVVMTTEYKNKKIKGREAIINKDQNQESSLRTTHYYVILFGGKRRQRKIQPGVEIQPA